MKRWMAVSLGVVLSLSAALGSGTEEPDPFYLRLLEEGRRLLEQGRAEDAVRSLRLACFGLLESPDRLAGCWVHLGLARSELKDREGLLEVLRKLEELEERFQVFSLGRVRAEDRDALFERFVEVVGSEELVRSLLVGYFVVEWARRELELLPEERRERELRRRLETESRNPIWRLLAAERELVAGQASEVEGWLKGFPAGFGGGYVACLRAAAGAQGGACGRGEFNSCPMASKSVVIWKAELNCLLASGRREEALRLWSQLTPELQGNPQLSEVAADFQSLAEPQGRNSDLKWLSSYRVRLRTAQTAADLSALEQELQQRERVPLSDREFALLRAELAYRGSRWEECKRWYRSVGLETLKEAAPRFYAAVCLWESGEREEARRLASSGLEGLPRNAFLDGYLKKMGVP